MAGTPRTARASLLAAGVALLAVAAAACGGPTATTGTTDDAATDERGCISDFDPGRDYFPDKSEVRDAENFELTYEDSYQVLTVDQPYPGGDPEQYVLVRCGAPDPELSGALADAPRVQVPVSSVYAASTTQLPMLDALERLDALTGVADVAYVTSPEVNDLVEQGRVAQYARGGTVDAERVVADDPDVLLTEGTEDPAYPALRRAGIPVVADAEYLEPTPLGRAEWVKVVAALTGTEARAAEVYDDVRSRYVDLAGSVADVDPASVLVGAPYQGTWSMPAGGTYMGRLVADAGGTYPWLRDDSNHSLQLGLEAVFSRAGDAPTWLVNNPWETTRDAVREDERYARLAAVRDGQVWSSTKVVGPGGGNDLYERGVLRPDLVLGDLVAILHPDAGGADEHDFAFYTPVPRP